MRYGLILLCILFGSVTTADAQVSIGIGLPGVSIGINVPHFPQFARVPGYPVYYAPRLHSNLFFYDGMYWAYNGNNWYASSWYNGPWDLVAPEIVPLFVLRIPVGYYRNPPPYFRGWRSDAPPRWGEHWGRQWERQRRGWDRWDRRAVPAPAPLPGYQRHYSGNRYPRADQQQHLRDRNYRYQPRDPEVRQYYQGRAVNSAPSPSRREQRSAPQDRGSRQQDSHQRDNPPSRHQQDRPASPRSEAPQKGREDVQQSTRSQSSPQQGEPAAQGQRQQSSHGATQGERETSRSGGNGSPQDRGSSQAQPKPGQDQKKDHRKDEQSDQDQNR